MSLNLPPIPLASDRNENNQYWKRGIKTRYELIMLPIVNDLEM